jgi:uncharacterized membrane protein
VEYVIVKWLHILSSTLLFGTGLGSAFYMFFASRTRNAHVISVVTRYVVIADWVFTTPTIIFQPLSGFYLLHLMSVPLTSKWIVWTILLYIVAGGAWLPVVWMQIKMRDMATIAAARRTAVPDLYWVYLRRWIALGVIAFTALVIVFYLMVAKPM